MENPIAYCGLDCSQCPTYLATQADDDQQRAAVVEQWSKQLKWHQPHTSFRLTCSQ